MPEAYSYFALVNSKVRGSRIFIDPNEYALQVLNCFSFSLLAELLKSPASVGIKKRLLREIRNPYPSEGTIAVMDRLVDRPGLGVQRGE